jgi:hypothetical protein
MNKSAVFTALSFYSPKERRLPRVRTLPLLFLGMWGVAIGAALPSQAFAASYKITTTWYEPMTDPFNTIFVGAFDYDSNTHAVTNLRGQLSEAMGGNEDWLSLNHQLANGDALHQYTWHDNPLGGTFATVFLNNDSLTFSTANGGDGWSPQAGVNANCEYPTSGEQNAYAMIFVPDNLSLANTISNPLSLTWDEGNGLGSAGLAHTAYADYTDGGNMGNIGMTATSKRIYGAAGTMEGVPLSEVITAVPEPSTFVLLVAALASTALMFRGRGHNTVRRIMAVAC